MMVGPPTILNYPPFAKLWPQRSPVIDLVFKSRKGFLGNWILGLWSLLDVPEGPGRTFAIVPLLVGCVTSFLLWGQRTGMMSET